MNRMLVAYDGSESGRRALDEAARLAHDGVAVTVVAVAEPLPQVGRAAPLHFPEEYVAREHDLAEATSFLQERGVDAQAVERRGDAATAILDEADAEDADLIVMGTRGLGSVSTKVLHHARCNVLVVR